MANVHHLICLLSVEAKNTCIRNGFPFYMASALKKQITSLEFVVLSLVKPVLRVGSLLLCCRYIIRVDERICSTPQ